MYVNKKLIDVINNPTKYFRNPHAIKVCKDYRATVIKYGDIMTDDMYRKLYEAVIGGDTKTRTLRARRADIRIDYLKKYGLFEDLTKR